MNLTAVQPFLHLVSLLLQFTFKCVTQYSVLWSSLFYHQVNNYTVKGLNILSNHTSHSSSLHTYKLLLNQLQNSDDKTNQGSVIVTCHCNVRLLWFPLIFLVFPTLLCLPDATLRSSVNRVAEYLCVATNWRNDCRVATPAPAVPPWRGAVVWCRVGGVVWGPAGYSRLRHGRGKTGTCPYMHRGQ